MYASFLYFLKRIVFVKRHVWFFRIYVYTVIQQKAILGISNLLPSDKAMLVRIPYFGKKGAEKYGDVILEMVRVYRKEKGLAEPELL